MYTINKLCEISGLSRSTLLYYDSIGLLKPDERSISNYRLYSDDSVKILDKICIYREAGMRLTEIAQILDSPENQKSEVLERTLSLLNEEARKIREKQNIIIEMLNGKGNLSDDNAGKRRKLIYESLKLIGIDEAATSKLHVYLEKNSPDIHLDFLEAMGFSSEEIDTICSKAKSLIKDKHIQGVDTDECK